MSEDKEMDKFISDLDAQFNTGMAPKKEYPAIPVTNEDGTPKIYDLTVSDVGSFDGTDFNTHEPTKNLKFTFKIEGLDRTVSLITATMMKRNSPAYKAAPNMPNKLLDLWLKCGMNEPAVNETVSARDLLGKTVRAELGNKEKDGQVWPRIERLFLKK